MRSLICICALLHALTAGAAEIPADGEPTPLEIRLTRTPKLPLSLMVMHNGKLQPVIGVSGDRALVQIDGQKVKAEKHAVFSLRPAAETRSTVRILYAQTESLMTVTRSVGDGVRIGREQFNGDNYALKIKAEQDEPDCYLAVVYYPFFPEKFGIVQNPPFPKAKGPELVVKFKHIGNLRAGRETDLDIFYGRDGNHERLGRTSFPMIFSHGREISDSIDAGSYWSDQLISNHPKALSAYLEANAGSDHELTAYWLPRFVTRDVNSASALPPNTCVDLKVNENGKPVEFKFTTKVPEFAKDSILLNIAHCLFLPRIEAGRPIATVVTIPIVLAD